MMFMILNTGEDVTPAMRQAHRKSVSSTETDTATYVDHSYKTLWNQAVAGFTLHTFNSDFTELTTDYMTNTGEVVNTFVVNKAGTIISQGTK